MVAPLSVKIKYFQEKGGIAFFLLCALIHNWEEWLKCLKTLLLFSET